MPRQFITPERLLTVGFIVDNPEIIPHDRYVLVGKKWRLTLADPSEELAWTLLFEPVPGDGRDLVAKATVDDWPTLFGALIRLSADWGRLQHRNELRAVVDEIFGGLLASHEKTPVPSFFQINNRVHPDDQPPDPPKAA